MKKNFKYYLAIWAVLVVLFNSVLFLVVGNTYGIGNTKASFWIAYVLIMISFVLQILCARSAFSGDSKKLFYGLPLISVSVTGLVVSVIIGVAVMSIQAIPVWIGAVICLVIAAFQAIAMIRAKAAADVVSNKDDDIKQKTSFIREMTAEAEIMYKNASSPEEKCELKKLYEAFRYSDPVSTSSTFEVEQEIRQKNLILKEKFSVAYIQELILLIKKRSAICKDLK